jgi:ABC-type amino acid transport substrate-binding protein
MGDEVRNSKLQISNFKNVLAQPRERWLIITLIVIVLGVWTWELVVSRAREDLAWRRIHARGVFTVATDASYPPFSAVDENGNLFGFEIDLAEEIARRWGVRAGFENIAYDALLGTLISGRDDAVISAFAPQPGRTKEVSFTRSYFVGGTVAVVRAAEGEGPGDDPLKWAAGKTLAVEHGAGGDALARQWMRRTTGITLLPYPTAGDALQTVESAVADAALVDAVSAYVFLLDNPSLKLAGPPLEPEPYTIAVSARSHTLFRELERALEAMEADGTLPALRVKWFGVAAR